MMKINECMNYLAELLVPEASNEREILSQQLHNNEIPGISKAKYSDLRTFVLNSFADIGGQPFIRTFNNFQSFYDWLDTAEHYEQEDSEMSLSAHKPWLALVYAELTRNYEYLKAEQQKCGDMICSVCREKVATGQYRLYELPAVYVVEHRSCSEHDPEWAAMDKAEEDEKVRRAEYVAECRDFQAKWDTCALDDEIARNSI